MTDTDRSKYLMALLVIAAASGLLWLGRLDGAQWVSAVTWTVCGLHAGAGWGGGGYGVDGAGCGEDEGGNPAVTPTIS